ncbi:MAG: hypothetical protein ACI84C_000884 [Flavobacteriales bacterium]|jgi:hypothetical protein
MLSITRHFYLLLSLTALMGLAVGAFSINGYISWQQFDQFDIFGVISSIIRAEGKTFWFYAFFIIDFIWAPTFFLYLFRVLISWLENHRNYGKYLRICILAFISAAFGLDVLENCLYVWGFASEQATMEIIANVSFFKYLFAGLFMLIFFTAAYRFQLHSRIRTIGKFAVSSALSLVIIALIVLLLTQMDQGNTIVIHLLNHPINVAIAFVLVSFLGVILSHYPIYFEAALFPQPSRPVQWVMANKRRFLGFGVIYFNYNRLKVDSANMVLEESNVKTSQTEGKDKEAQVIEHLRKLIGVLIHLALFLILLTVAQECFLWGDIAATLTAGALVAAVVFYLHWHKGSSLDDMPGSDRPRPVKLAKSFPILVLVHAFAIVASMISSFSLGWSVITVVFSLLTCMTGMFAFLSFRITRSTLKYVFYNESLSTSKALWLKSSDPSKLATYTGPWKRYARLSNNVYYLFNMQNVGWATLAFTSLIIFSVDFAIWVNPLTMILALIVVGYSSIALYLKQILYYGQPKRPTKSKYKNYKYLLPLFGFVLIGWFAFSSSLGNSLHQITTAKESESDIISVAEYNNQISRDHKANRFFVGSYGGGLKADLWNMLLLENLQTNSKGEFLKSTACLSGVSGGGIGIANYCVLLTEEDKREASNGQVIDEIGEFNVLSIDLSMSAGLDLFRGLIPSNSLPPTDRSYVAMQRYAEMCGMEEEKYKSLTFRQYWNIAHKANDFPPLLINTVSTSGIQGIASTVGANNEQIVPGSIDILSGEEKKSLTYYGAASTCNRFPIFSPPARIKGKGHFLDGGYYDNSGLLAAFSFYNKTHGSDSSSNPVFVSISNSNSWYIHQILQRWNINPKSETSSGELSAILGTVASIDKIPNYIASYLKEEFDFVEIPMPHPFTYDQACAVLGNAPVDPLALIASIESHNDSIYSALDRFAGYDMDKWGVVVPPLARLLSKPAVEYQKAMIAEHWLVKQRLQTLAELSE